MFRFLNAHLLSKGLDPLKIKTEVDQLENEQNLVSFEDTAGKMNGYPRKFSFAVFVSLFLATGKEQRKMSARN